MALSNTQLATLVLIPGYAEKLETTAGNQGNDNLCGVAREVRYARTGLYTGITFTIMGVVGSAFKENSINTIYSGLGITLLSGIKLCRATSKLLERWPEFEIRYGLSFNPVL